jgi:hypothetical protein
VSAAILLQLLAVCVCVVVAQSGAWLKRVVALSDEIARQSALGVHEAPYLMSHRSFSVPPFAAPSQNASLSAQLDMGVRALHLELHVVPEFATDPLRVCHAPRTDAIAMQCGSYGWPLCDAIGIPRLAPDDLGCQRTSSTLAATLRAVVAWLAAQPASPRPLVLLSLVSRITVNDTAVPGIDVSALVSAAFSDSGALPLLLPVSPQGFPNRSLAEADGKSLLAVWQHINVDTQRTAGIAPQLIWQTPSPTALAASDLLPFAAVCTPGTATYGDFAAINGLQIVFEDTASLKVFPTGPPLYSPVDVYGALSPGRVATALSCGMTLALDFVAPSRLADAIWSFAVDEPSPTTADRCVLMDVATGRWRTADCARPLPFACVGAGSGSMGRVGTWFASANPAPWTATAGGNACPTGSSHSLPANSLQNAALRSLAAGAAVTELWLDYHRPASDWVPFAARTAGGAAGRAAPASGTTPPASPIRPAATPMGTGTAAPIVLTNGAGFPVTNAMGGSFVVPVLTLSATGTDANGAPATRTVVNPIVTLADGSPKTASPGVVETEPSGLPPAPTNQTAKRFALGFDNSTILGQKRPPPLAELPSKPATSLRYAFFTPGDGATGLQKDEFCLPDSTGVCRWEVYVESILWPSAAPLILAVLAFPLVCCAFWIIWACCMSGSEPAEDTCCPRDYFDDTGAYYYSSQVRFVMLGLIVMSAICAIVVVPVLIGTAGVRAAEQRVTETFLQFVADFQDEVVGVAEQLLGLRDVTAVDPGRERVLRDRIIAEVARQAQVSTDNVELVQGYSGQLHSATLAIMLVLLLSLVVCGIGAGVCRSIVLSYCLGCSGFIFIALCWLVFAVHYSPAIAIADFCQVYGAPNNPAVGIGGLLRDTIYCESFEAQLVLRQITTDYINTGTQLCAAADRECSRRDAPCPNRPLQQTCAVVDCTDAPPFDRNNTCTVATLLSFGRNFVTDYGSGCPALGGLSFAVGKCDNDVSACEASAVPCEPRQTMLQECPTACRNEQLRNSTARLVTAATSIKRIDDALSELRALIACNVSSQLREEIATVMCGDMYASLVLVYTPCAILGIFLVVPVMLAIKGIKRFNRDYWKPVAAHQRPPGRYTIGRRRLPGAKLNIEGEQQREPLRQRRKTDHAVHVRPKSVSPAVAAMKQSGQGGGGGGGGGGGAAVRERPKDERPDGDKPVRMSTLDIKARKALNRQTAPPSSAQRRDVKDDESGGDEMIDIVHVSPRNRDQRKTVAVVAAAPVSKPVVAAAQKAQPQRHSMAPTTASAVAAQQVKAQPIKQRTATEMATTLPTVGKIEPSGRYDELGFDLGDEILNAAQAAPALSSSDSDDSFNDDLGAPPAVPRSLSASSYDGDGDEPDAVNFGDLPAVPPMFGDDSSASM